MNTNIRRRKRTRHENFAQRVLREFIEDSHQDAPEGALKGACDRICAIARAYGAADCARARELRREVEAEARRVAEREQSLIGRGAEAAGELRNGMLARVGNELWLLHVTDVVLCDRDALERPREYECTEGETE